jgi:hypothetical protein
MILRCTCTFHPLHPCRTAFYLCPSAGQDRTGQDRTWKILRRFLHTTYHIPGALLDRGTCDIGASSISNSNLCKAATRTSPSRDRTSRCHIFPITTDEGHHLGSKALHVELTSCILPLTCPSTDTHLFKVVLEVSKECQINK